MAEKINIDTYRFMSNQTINEILKTQTSWPTDEKCLMAMINNDGKDRFKTRGYATEKELNILKRIEEDSSLSLKEKVCHIDNYGNYLAAKHWNNQNRRFELNHINNITDWKYELPEEEIQELHELKRPEQLLNNLEDARSIVEQHTQNDFVQSVVNSTRDSTNLLNMNISQNSNADNQNINTEEFENLRKENQELKSILYDECLIEVNGKDRLCKNGLLQAFSNAVIKIDEHNKRITHSHEEELNHDSNNDIEL